MSVLYTDNDPQICAWAEELVKAQLVPHGTVLCKSISDLQSADLAGYAQVHLFAGILGWPYALRLAGWPDAIPVWSGSCPCQPFSCAGQRKGTSDKRHLWPEMRRLIEQCQPPVVFGEQVASKDGRLWLSGVRADLEALGYAVGGSDLCAAGVGAPHIRQRLFWVAHNGGAGLEIGSEQSAWSERQAIERSGEAGGVGKPESEQAGIPGQPRRQPNTSVWADFDPIPCADGKTRRVRSGTFPLVNGSPARVLRLRGYGNCIVPEVAAEFITASIEAICEITC